MPPLASSPCSVSSSGAIPCTHSILRAYSVPEYENSSPHYNNIDYHGALRQTRCSVAAPQDTIAKRQSALLMPVETLRVGSLLCLCIATESVRQGDAGSV